MNAAALPTGAEIRAVRPDAGTVVLCMNGGTARPCPGTWSASIEWLVGRLAPRFPGTGFAEVRYRIRSWKDLPSCIADGQAALSYLRSAERVLLLGFSMGGAVSIGCAGDERVRDLVALAPWIPADLPLNDLLGDRVTIIHGSIDGWLPGIPGVRPSHSREGAERLRAAGAEVRYELIRGGVHGLAIRRGRRLIGLSRAARWESAVAAALVRAGEDDT